MNFPKVITIQLDNENEYRLFTALKNEVSKIADFQELLDKINVRPANEEEQARVRISGQEIAKGTRSDMAHRYRQEYSMHPTSRIVLEEMVDGKWEIVKGTRSQSVNQ